MFTVAGQDGRVGSTLMPDEGEDSASKRAWRTAASLFVNDGRACVMLVMMVVWELLKWSKCFGVKVDHVKLVEIQGKIL
jgi:hypothetical protein